LEKLVASDEFGFDFSSIRPNLVFLNSL
jgi:hypothetical protein